MVLSAIFFHIALVFTSFPDSLITFTISEKDNLNNSNGFALVQQAETR